MLLTPRRRVITILLALTAWCSTAGARQLPLIGFGSPDAAAQWQAVNDGVMGGVSDGRFRITGRRTLEFHGMLSLENNGGFASVRSRPRALDLEPGDTLVARVRGDGREYELHLYTPRWRMAFSYRAPLKTRAGQWIDVAVPLDRFQATAFGRALPGEGPPDPRDVHAVGFLLADKKPGPFLLEVGWIRVLRRAPR